MNKDYIIEIMKKNLHVEVEPKYIKDKGISMASVIDGFEKTADRIMEMFNTELDIILYDGEEYKNDK